MGKLKNKSPRTGYVAPSSLMSQDVDREWKDVYPETLQKNDIVAGVGIIVSVDSYLTCRNEVVVSAGMPDTKEHFLENDIKVKAFVKKVG